LIVDHGDRRLYHHIRIPRYYDVFDSVRPVAKRNGEIMFGQYELVFFSVSERTGVAAVDVLTTHLGKTVIV
jgi:hypothetical protein